MPSPLLPSLPHIKELLQGGKFLQNKVSDAGKLCLLRDDERLSQSYSKLGFFLQLTGGGNALPSGGNFDEHALARYARGLIQPHDLACLGNGGLGIKGEPRIHLTRNTTGCILA